MHLNLINVMLVQSHQNNSYFIYTYTCVSVCNLPWVISEKCRLLSPKISHLSAYGKAIAMQVFVLSSQSKTSKEIRLHMKRGLMTSSRNGFWETSLL